MRIIQVHVVVPPRLLLLDIAGPIEVLRCANQAQSAVRFEVKYIGPSASLRSSVGLTISAIEPLPETLPDNAWIVVAGDVEQTILQGAPGGRAEGDTAQEAAIAAWLRQQFRPGCTLITICSGALLAARAGLLDGRDCTTHHACCAELAGLAPGARVLENRLYVEDRGCFSSAGITAGIDLMLHLVARATDQICALAAARYLVVYLRRSGADPQLSPWLEGRNHIHPAVHRVQDAIAADPTKTWTLTELAKIAAVSTRHLSRLFQEHAGLTIPEYSNRLRVGLAQELLAQTRLDMERVAEQSGFASSRQLRRAWSRLYPTAPRQARRQQPSEPGTGF
jgi:transcriptional regulator GlxA family with amidase domain